MNEAGEHSLYNLPEKLYTMGDVAAMFTVDRKTVALWVEKARLLPVMDVGNKNRHSYRFHPKDVENFFESEKARCRSEFERRKVLLKAVKG